MSHLHPHPSQVNYYNLSIIYFKHILLSVGLPLSNRPPSRPTTPSGHNPFDVIQRAPSITMEKIKNQTSATLDRMSILQQRYRQHQEIRRNSELDPSRRLSSASQMDLDSAVSVFMENKKRVINFLRMSEVQRSCIQPLPGLLGVLLGSMVQ